MRNEYYVVVTILHTTYYLLVSNIAIVSIVQ
jgi:hypothetical protein